MVATYTETHPPVLGRPGSNYLTKIGGAAPSDVRYTEAVRPRYVRNIANGKPTKDPYVRVCVNCQDLHDEDMFPPEGSSRRRRKMEYAEWELTGRKSEP